MTKKNKHLPLTRSSFYPLYLAFGLILLDQLTKLWVIANIDINTIYWTSGENQFFRLIHVRNLGAGFSMFHNLATSAPILRVLILMILPTIFLLLIAYYVLYSTEFTRPQKWALSFILGGGLGNIIDRIFRPHGVVDFLDVRFYGLLGMERWPTFNIADASVVVGALLLIWIGLPIHKKTTS